MDLQLNQGLKGCSIASNKKDKHDEYFCKEGLESNGNERINSDTMYKIARRKNIENDKLLIGGTDKIRDDTKLKLDACDGNYVDGEKK